MLTRASLFSRLPVVLVAILGMTYRYMFLFLQTARDMFESRETRMVGVLEPADRRRLAAASAGVLLGKTLQVSGEVHTAMQARGFRGEIRLLDELQMRAERLAAAGRFVGAATRGVVGDDGWADDANWLSTCARCPTAITRWRL